MSTHKPYADILLFAQVFSCMYSAPAIMLVLSLMTVSPSMALNNIEIETVISCDSYVMGEIENITDTKYYLFTNNRSATDTIFIVLCPTNNATNFDTLLYIYDEKLNPLGYNDTGYGCMNRQSQIILFEPSFNNSTYIVQIAGNNAEYGEYHMQISCMSTVNTTTYFTTSQPTNNPTIISSINQTEFPSQHPRSSQTYAPTYYPTHLPTYDSTGL